MPEWFEYALNFTVVGLLIVFGALIIVALLVAFISKVDDRWRERESAEKQSALAADQNIDTTTLILISAAAATLLQGKFHIRRVRRLLRAGGQRSPWSTQGRAILMGSHVVSKRR